MEILCPICAQPLEQTPKIWRCGKGHAFDVARQGYVNLLPVNQKHSKNPGDPRQQVAARKAFLDRGHYAPIARMTAQLLQPYGPQCILDAGCGEGYYLASLKTQFPQAERVGLDISKDAARYAAVRDPAACWLTATAAHMPFANQSFDAILCMFAMTAETEFYRCLRPGGVFLQVLAGEEHLMGLKRLIYPEILKREKQMHPHLPGFILEKSETLRFPFCLTDNGQIQELLAMTPHFWRISREGLNRAESVEILEDTAQVIFNVYRPLAEK